MQASDTDEMIHVHDEPRCDVCGSRGATLYANLRDRLYRTPGAWNLARCPSCGFVWLDPCPVPEDINKLYCEYYTHAGDEASSPLTKVLDAVGPAILASTFGYRDLSARGAIRGAGRWFRWVGPLRDMVGGTIMWLNASDCGRLLDVGCGAGHLLAKMRDLGWDVVGVEPDTAAADVAERHFGLTVHRGTIDDALFPAGSFDAITMSHVIEHVPDIGSMLRECRRLLSDRGRLVIVTPNVGSLGRRVFGRHWLSWDPPRHLHLFAPDTLRRYLEREGFSVTMVRTTARASLLFYGPSVLIRRRGAIYGYPALEQGLPLRLAALAFHAIEYCLSRILPVGEEIVLVARKGGGDSPAHPVDVTH